MTEKELSIIYAVDLVISDLGNKTHSQFYDALCDETIPDDVSIWQPFENYSADDLLELVNDLSEHLIKFKNETKGGLI